MSNISSSVSRGYKVFNSDWTCRGFRFEVGQTYSLPDGQRPVPCEQGFHFCEIAVDCFNYYSFDPSNKVAIVEAIGDVVVDADKSCTNVINVVEEVSWEKLLTLVNVGKGNSGYQNSGDRNSGNWNSGNWNSGNWNSGYLNSTTPTTIRIFNKDVDVKVWEKAHIPDFFHFNITLFVPEYEMSKEEKEQNEGWEAVGGYLKVVDYKEAWQESYRNASQEDRELVKQLPNFDADVFFEITGIRVE